MKPSQPKHIRTVVLGPYGQIQSPKVIPNSGGANIVTMFDGEPIIPRHHRDAGWVFYEDVCNGNYTPIAGGEPVKDMRAWRLKVKAMEAQDKGLRLPTPLPADFYHPEVLERRKRSRYGQHVAEASVYVDDAPEPDADADDEPEPQTYAPKKGGRRARSS